MVFMGGIRVGVWYNLSVNCSSHVLSTGFIEIITHVSLFG